MGKTLQSDTHFKPPVASTRNRSEVLRDIKLALTTSTNYGRGPRLQGFDPYDCQLGKAPKDVWQRRSP
jgi:hypothetical protein